MSVCGSCTLASHLAISSKRAPLVPLSNEHTLYQTVTLEKRDGKDAKVSPKQNKQNIPLFIEVHQQHQLLDADMVEDKTMETQMMAEEMNKNITAHLISHLPLDSYGRKGMPAN